MKKQNKKNNNKNNNKNANPNRVISSAFAHGTKSVYKPPKVSYNTNGNCRISHSEFVADIYSSATARAESFSINPQDSNAFTWLCAIATRYEMYKFHKLSFTYKPSCSTTTTGFVVMGLDFDAYDEAPSKQAILAWKHNARSPLWGEMAINCTSSLGAIPVKYCGIHTLGDVRVSDLGRLWIYNDGAQTIINVGEIYVSYEIELIQPALKVPPAIYFDYASPTPTYTGAKVFDNVADFIGNLRPLKVNDNTLLIKTAGKYLVSYFSGSSGVTQDDAPTITFTADSASPATEFSSYVVEGVKATNGGIRQSYLNLAQGAVKAVFLANNSGADVRHHVMMSTYDPYKGPI